MLSYCMKNLLHAHILPAKMCRAILFSFSYHPRSIYQYIGAHAYTYRISLFADTSAREGDESKSRKPTVRDKLLSACQHVCSRGLPNIIYLCYMQVCRAEYCRVFLVCIMDEIEFIELYTFLRDWHSYYLLLVNLVVIF